MHLFANRRRPIEWFSFPFSGESQVTKFVKEIALVMMASVVRTVCSPKIVGKSRKGLKLEKVWGKKSFAVLLAVLK